MVGWVAERDVKAGARMRLFCLPHAGSGAGAYYRWRRGLEGVEVCPVMLPGRELRMAEASRDDCAGLVAELMEATRTLLDVPYAIFGHSMGALIGYEWARAIGQAGLAGPVCLFVSGRNAAHLAFPHRDLHRLSDEEFVNELRRRYGGMPEGFLEEGELREVFLPILRADLKLVESYRFSEGRLDCPVMALAGVEDASVSDEGLEAWGELTEGEFGARRLPGGHFYHLGVGQEELLEVLRGRMGLGTAN